MKAVDFAHVDGVYCVAEFSKKVLGGVAFGVRVAWFEADFDFGKVFHGLNAGQLTFKRFCRQIGKGYAKTSVLPPCWTLIWALSVTLPICSGLAPAFSKMSKALSRSSLATIMPKPQPMLNVVNISLSVMT